jgi:N,N'-diacetyllegionaminate synthase
MKLILDCCNNHLGNNYIVKEMIQTGSDFAEYMKFQLYDTRLLNKQFPNFDTKKKLYSDFELLQEDVEFIFDMCTIYKVKPMFTIFCESRIPYLADYISEDFGIKIASPDGMKIDFIKKIQSELPGKTLIISTGMSSTLEILSTRKVINNAKFLYCISKYPTHVDDITFSELTRYDGFSDHTDTLEAATLIGSFYPELEYYEKHFTLSRVLPGTDQSISVQANELLKLHQSLEKIKIHKDYRERFGQK